MSMLRTIPDLLAAAVERCADKPALGVIEQGALRWQTWQEVGEAINRWAAALASLGVGRGDHVAQLSPNCLEWILVDLALHQLGAVHAPLHVSLSEEQLAGQVRHSEAKLLVVHDKLAPRITGSFALVRHDDLRSAAGGCSAKLPEGKASPEDLATILYTSGTTGQPRGVMLSQGNLTSNAIAVSEAVAAETSEVEETRLVFLPLSHIYARTCDLYSWLYRGTRLALAETRETILRDCQLVRPTTINGVPYFYQKIADQLRGSGGAADELALRNVFGGEIRRLSCGGAGVAPEVEQFFAKRNLPILSGYGLTEASPVITASPVASYKPGTAGRAVPETEVRLAEDGEILVRGAGVMQGYWRDPEATAEILRDGWLHTGDLGVWEGENLAITGRKKELIVLATGKNVSPTTIEQRLVGSPLIEQACVVGEGRKFLAAIVVPNPDALREVIREKKLWVWSKRRAVAHLKIRSRFQQEIDRTLAEGARHEQIGAFVVVPRGFSLELGELTPKMSLKREVIEQHFVKEIESLYR